MKSLTQFKTAIVVSLIFNFIAFDRVMAHEEGCPIFKHEDAERLRKSDSRPVSTSINCLTNKDFQFQKYPEFEHFEVSYHEHDPSDPSIHIWKDFRLDTDLETTAFEEIESLENLISIEIRENRDPELVSNERVEISALIEKIQSTKNSDDNHEYWYLFDKNMNELRSILSKTNLYERVIPSSLHSATSIIKTFVVRNNCYPILLNANKRAKNGFCVGEASIAEFAGCQIGFNPNKPVNRRGIVWLDEVPTSTQDMKPARAKCWLVEDFRELRNYFTPKQRRHLCRRNGPAKVPGGTCPK